MPQCISLSFELTTSAKILSSSSQLQAMEICDYKVLHVLRSGEQNF